MIAFRHPHISAIFFACLIALVPGPALSASPGSIGPAQAQADHARGACGSLGPGTGLAQGKGWIVSMMPGKHQLRVTGGGQVFLTAARLQAWDFDAGRPYYVVTEGMRSSSTLEWKVPGKSWAPVPTTFLYPPQGVTYADPPPRR